MKISVLEVILGVVGLISLASLGAILLFISAPATSDVVSALLTVSIFLFLLSALTFAGLAARRKFVTPENRKAILTIAFREAVLVSLLAVIYLWLAHFNVFKVWTALPLALIFIGAEYLMLVKGRVWIR